jgi:hypothetical protein
MTALLVFDKTVKGMEELSTRKHGLASRLRSLLVLVDGKSDVQALVKKVAGLGLGEDSIAELLEQEYIAPHGSATVPSSPPGKVASPISGKPAVVVQPPAKAEAAPSPAETAPHAEAILPAGESQFEALYHFYTNTIKSTLGLRGFGMQLKVERCANIDDFRALRQTYVDAVLKSKGLEMARSLGDRLDQLLNL